MEKDDTTETALTETAGPGEIKIHEDVITSIVRKKIGEVPGVSRISGNSFVDNLAEIVGSKKIQNRAISVEMGDNKVSVSLSINILFGFALPKVAAELQKAVSQEIANLTGMKAAKVNITVCEIEDPKEEEESSDDSTKEE